MARSILVALIVDFDKWTENAGPENADATHRLKSRQKMNPECNPVCSIKHHSNSHYNQTRKPCYLKETATIIK